MVYPLDVVRGSNTYFTYSEQKQIHSVKQSGGWSSTTGSGPSGPKAMAVDVAIMSLPPKCNFLDLFHAAAN